METKDLSIMTPEQLKAYAFDLILEKEEYIKCQNNTINKLQSVMDEIDKRPSDKNEEAKLD